MMENKIRVVELFAGIGAQRQALKNAGIDHEIIAVSEIDKYALLAYEKLHGPMVNLGDICKIEKIPASDLWTYSFPCTDISVAAYVQQDVNLMLLLSIVIIQKQVQW